MRIWKLYIISFLLYIWIGILFAKNIHKYIQIFEIFPKLCFHQTFSPAPPSIRPSVQHLFPTDFQTVTSLHQTFSLAPPPIQPSVQHLLPSNFQTLTSFQQTFSLASSLIRTSGQHLFPSNFQSFVFFHLNFSPAPPSICHSFQQLLPSDLKKTVTSFHHFFYPVPHFAQPSVRHVLLFDH